MRGFLLAKDSEGKPLEDDGAVFSHERDFFEDMKGFMIRAAIAYLKDVLSKPVTEEDMDPLMKMYDYRLRVRDAINILSAWVREPDPSASKAEFSFERAQKYLKRVTATGYPHDSWTDEENYNYDLVAIQKWGVPMALHKLEMAGVQRYALCFGELEPLDCQEIVVFLDTVMPFFEEQFGPATYKVSDAKAFKRVFELCPEDGSVVLQYKGLNEKLFDRWD